MNEFESQQISLMHRMVTVIMRVVLTAMVFGFLVTVGLAIEVVRTEVTVRALNDLRASRASDIAQQAARNCAYTKGFVAVFHVWATGLNSAEQSALTTPGLNPQEKIWHESRIATYSTLFKSLDTLGTNACPKGIL